MEAPEGVFKHNCAKQGRTEFWWGEWPRLLEEQSILYCVEGLKSSGSSLSWHISVTDSTCVVWRFPQVGGEKKKKKKINKQANKNVSLGVAKEQRPS